MLRSGGMEPFMKLAFSTIGCPDWSFEEIFATAKDFGMNGFEVRGIGNELHAPKIKPFLPPYLEGTKKLLSDSGIEIPMLTSSACIGSRGKMLQNYINESNEYINLAASLGVPFIRVLCSKNPQPDEEVDIDFLAGVYAQICEYGEKKGVTPLIETNGVLSDSAVMARLLAKVTSQNRGVLWDVHHPYRFNGETPEQTVSAIGSEIKYLHVKDSVFKNGKVEYRMMGYGDVPVLDALKAMKAIGYEGYVSLEWVKRWIPDLEEPGIVFAHFANYMTWLMKAL